MRRRLASVCAVALSVGMLAASPATASASTGDGGIAAAVGLETAAGDPHVTFVGRVTPLPAALEAEMRGTTWKPGCPVPLSDLRLIAVSYWGFDAKPHIGPLVVNTIAANEIVWVFHQLFEHHFPIHNIKLAREFHPAQENHDTPGDPTAAFNCRPVVTPTGAKGVFSQHSYGLAVDINPIENPFVENGYVRNKYSRPYRDRSRSAPGMIHDGDFVVRSFEAIGWGWGGHWHSGQDYMHFSASGT
ncbi:MAG: M15 family metallopeptidase [Actinomycetota bacterium]